MCVSTDKKYELPHSTVGRQSIASKPGSPLPHFKSQSCDALLVIRYGAFPDLQHHASLPARFFWKPSRSCSIQPHSLISHTDWLIGFSAAKSSPTGGDQPFHPSVRCISRSLQELGGRTAATSLALRRIYTVCRLPRCRRDQTKQRATRRDGRQCHRCPVHHCATFVRWASKGVKCLHRAPIYYQSPRCPLHQ